MIIRFPAALDGLPLPADVASWNAGQTVDRVTIVDLMYLIAALERKLGCDSSTDGGSIDARVAANAVAVAAETAARLAPLLVKDDIVRPFITVGGSSGARTFSVKLARADNSAPLANLRGLLHWWCASSSFGGPAAVTDQTYAVTTGVDLLHANTYGLGHGLTDATGTFVVTVSNAHSATPASVYFLCEFQGLIYQATGQVWTTGAP